MDKESGRKPSTQQASCGRRGRCKKRESDDNGIDGRVTPKANAGV